jgi:hypothetical protein
MTEAERCRTLAEADRGRAAESDLPFVRMRHLLSAAVWQARADMCERTGLKSVDDESATA